MGENTEAMKTTTGYELRLESTQASAGYFMCVPEGVETIDEMIAHLEKSPFDEFMRRYALRTLAQMPENELIDLADSENPMLLSLLYETASTQSFLPELRNKLAQTDPAAAAAQTPLIYLKSLALENRELHSQWAAHFANNFDAHQPLPAPDEIGLPFPVSDQAERTFMDIGPLSKEIKSKNNDSQTRPAPEETAARALEQLEKAGVFADIEMRHVSSLSPIALLRKWHMDITVHNGRHSHRVSGIQTSYGRGLSLETARASLLMEVVERCASFASIGPDGVLGRTRNYPLVKATETELLERGEKVLSPNDLGLEVPYNNEPLHWIRGEAPNGNGGLNDVLLPVQIVFLFCNPDETSLFSSMPSTGLASGNTLAGAKVSALMEAIERHTEATVPYNPDMCFELISSDPKLGPLLSAYRRLGVSVRFQDLTTASGIPCCKAFVTGPDNQVHKGTSASLNARKAIVSALTEVPWPFPDSSPTRNQSGKLPMVDFENLPDYGTGNDTLDLELVETLLASAGYTPVYVDLTRKDMEIPVVKAIVPGFQLSADMDNWSRISPELFHNYLKMHS